ncbi:long-chain-fatty-acid--CoA ligase [Brooklawnia cerclae]
MCENAAMDEQQHGADLPPWRRTLEDGAPYWTKNYQPGVPTEIELPTESLVSLLETAVREGGSHVATEFFGAEMTYRELGEAVARAAEGLRQLGVHAGDRVALVLPNCPQHLIAFYAVLRLGAIVVEHNPLYTAPELEHMFTDHGARVAIAMDTTIDKLTQMPTYVRPTAIVSVNLLKAFPRVKQVLLGLPVASLRAKRAALTSGTKGTTSWERLLKHRPISRRHPKPSVDDIAAIQYTSGTTGRAKGAMLSHFNLYSNARQGEAWMLGAQPRKETSYAALPMFHSFGVTMHLTFGVLKQARQVLFPKPDVEMIVAEAKRRPPSIYCVVPALYQRTAELAKKRHISLASARWCISGAMALVEDTRELWESVSGGLLVEGYGLTEASPVALGNPFFPSRRSGTIGMPFPSTLMKVVDVDDPTREVGMNEPGELLIKGPQVFQGYWRNPEETARTLIDGWLRTGDVVTVDEDGFTTIVDRKKEIIITGGFNVSPTEVETELLHHDDIADVAVVGMPTGKGDERVVAAVVLHPGASLNNDAMRAWAKQRLAAYKVPRRFVEVDDLPRSMLGKVLRGQVKAQLVALAPEGGWDGPAHQADAHQER